MKRVLRGLKTLPSFAVRSLKYSTSTASCLKNAANAITGANNNPAKIPRPNNPGSASFFNPSTKELVRFLIPAAISSKRAVCLFSALAASFCSSLSADVCFLSTITTSIGLS